MNFELEPIIPSGRQINTLFQLLCDRKYSISHKNTPTLEEHSEFVRNHPYRAWFLIEVQHEYVGSVYLTTENTLGINVQDECIPTHTKLIMAKIKSMFEPLPAITSVRANEFSIVVPSSNFPLIKCLEEIGLEQAQIFYRI